MTPEKVGNIILGYVPLEEYLFFVLKSLAVGFPMVLILRWMQGRNPKWMPSILMKRFKYLFLEMVWFLPVIIAQWLLAPQTLRAQWKAIPLVALPVAAYLTVKDKVALKDGTWTISTESTTGLKAWRGAN